MQLFMEFKIDNFTLLIQKVGNLRNICRRLLKKMDLPNKSNVMNLRVLSQVVKDKKVVVTKVLESE